MREAKVLGSVTSTIKHPALHGKKLMVVQVLDAKGNPIGRPEVAEDCVGAGKGDHVVLSLDGSYMKDVHNDKHVPVRAWISGIIDKVYKS